MTPRVHRRTQVKRDLVKHFVYLAENAGIDTARAFRIATEDACRLLAEMPELGAKRPMKHPRLANLRMWPIKGFREFLIFYEPVDTGIRLIRIIHAKEDYWRVFNTL